MAKRCSHISFHNHFPSLNLVNDRGTVGMKEAPTSLYNFWYFDWAHNPMGVHLILNGVFCL